jgi:hypothetical protein
MLFFTRTLLAAIDQRGACSTEALSTVRVDDRACVVGENNDAFICVQVSNNDG